MARSQDLDMASTVSFTHLLDLFGMFFLDGWIWLVVSLGFAMINGHLMGSVPINGHFRNLNWRCLPHYKAYIRPM